MSAFPPPAVIGCVAALGVCAAVMGLGRGPVRRAAGFVAAGSILAWSARALAPQGWSEAMAALFDLGLLLALGSLAWKPAASWPVVLVGLQGLIVALDAIRAVEPGLRSSSFHIAASLVSAMLLATLLHAGWRSRMQSGLPS